MTKFSFATVLLVGQGITTSRGDASFLRDLTGDKVESTDLTSDPSRGDERNAISKFVTGAKRRTLQRLEQLGKAHQQQAQEQLEHNLGAASDATKSGVLSYPANRKMELMKNRRHRKSNSSMNNHHSSVEQECDPDVGVLTCTETEHHCVRDPGSSQGGFCTNTPSAGHRRAQQMSADDIGYYCDNDAQDDDDYAYDYFGISSSGECDCNNGFNRDTLTGSISCAYSLCSELDGDEVCLDVSATNTVSNGYIETIEYCWSSTIDGVQQGTICNTCDYENTDYCSFDFEDVDWSTSFVDSSSGAHDEAGGGNIRDSGAPGLLKAVAICGYLVVGTSVLFLIPPITGFV